MDAVLTSLGINNTLFIHFGIFLIAYLALSHLIFKPYLKALEEREKRTVGSADLTSRILEETESLKAEYQAKARQINSEIKEVMEAAKKEATDLYQTEVQLAQRIYLENLDELKARVETARNQSFARVDQEVDSVSRAISDRLVGRNVHA